jgi:hypothetical protein
MRGVSKDGLELMVRDARKSALLTMRSYFPSDAANALPSRRPSS